MRIIIFQTRKAAALQDAHKEFLGLENIEKTDITWFYYADSAIRRAELEKKK